MRSGIWSRGIGVLGIHDPASEALLAESSSDPILMLNRPDSGIRRTMRRIPVTVLTLFAVINTVGGCIHAFASDGGAQSIAGLDLSHDKPTILSLFAALGFHQLVMAAFQVFVLVVRRDLVVIALALQAAETALGLLNLYFYRTLPVVVPGQAFNAALLVLLAVTLGAAWISTRRVGSPPDAELQGPDR